MNAAIFSYPSLAHAAQDRAHFKVQRGHLADKIDALRQKLKGNDKFQAFTQNLEDIAAAEREESALLSRINAVEAAHAQWLDSAVARVQKPERERHATPLELGRLGLKESAAHNKDKKNHGLIWLLLLAQNQNIAAPSPRPRA